tara:strand:+ start:16143 stop:17087 length:945 start_codon:yes stop_codon:yes gene_type:complete
MALLGRKKILLAKIEPTYAATVTPTGSDALLVRSLEVTPFESDSVSRDLVRPYFGTSDVLLANKRVRCTFSVELAGSGTAGTAPQYGDVLRACGMTQTIVASTSVTYDPISSFTGNDSVTLVYNVDGVQHKVKGARGTFTLSCSNNEIPTIDFEMTGIYVDPTDTAQSGYTVAYSNQEQPELFQQGNTSSFQFHSFAGRLSSLSMALSNEVTYRQLIGDATGEVMILDRAPAGDVVIEAPVLSDKDYFAIAKDAGTGNLTFQHGQTAGNIVTMTAARCSLGAPSYSEDNSVQMLNMPYQATPTSGNDDFDLVYT